MANKFNNSIFKQYLGSLEQFKAYYSKLNQESQTALRRALIFIHDEAVDGTWNNDGYIFANGKYYTCRETNLTASMLLSLIETGNTSGVSVEEVEGKLVFTPCLKDELKALTNVGFVEAGKTWDAGTSLEQVLNDIFAKEVWYAASFNYAENLTVSMSKPSLTVTVDGTSVTGTSNTCEIGAPVTVSGSISASSYTGGDKFTVTCTTADNNGFVTNGATGTKLETLEVEALLRVKANTADALTIRTNSGAFSGATVSNNSVSGSGKIAGGTNSVSLRASSKTYVMTANPTDDQKVLTTLSNKDNYTSNETEGDVTVKHTVAKTYEESKYDDSTVTINGAYKFYYVWGAASLPTIPENFCGNLDGWEENWGSKTVNNNTPTELNGTIYVLKPTAVAADPTIKNEFGQAPAAGMAKSETTYTNKYGTTYKLYSFSANGAKYQTLVL